MANNSIPESYEELRAVVAGRVGLRPEEIDDSSSLLELGLDSVTATSMVGSWRRAGLSRPVDSFLDSPTLKDWWLLVDTERADI